MNKELYVSSTPHETKVALVEDDQLAEVFFERENEYTLAGSIYKGRVTRVLPGMQSAFVDIGLERDAFLYVSDFLELTGDEDEEEEFGEIPAPRGAIELGKTQPAPEAQAAMSQDAGTTTADEDADLEPIFDEEAPAATEEDGEATASSDQESGEGARRWRGRRRRRGGRRGRGFERDNRTESATNESTPAAEEVPAPREEPRPRQGYGPPAGYAPIILPGESISKYRNLSQPEPESRPGDEHTIAPAEELHNEHAETAAAYTEEIVEDSIHLDQGYDVLEPAPEHPAESATGIAAESGEGKEANASAEAGEEVERPRSRRRRWGWRRKAAEAEAATEAPNAASLSPSEPQAQSEAHIFEGGEHTPAHQETELAPPATAERHEVGQVSADPQPTHHHQLADESPLFEREHLVANESAGPQSVEERHAHADHYEHEADRQLEARGASTPEDHAAAQAAHHANVEQSSAPSSAPVGRTLEHEVIEEEEAELQPVPEDLGAIREVAGDEELVLEEETLDAANDFSERWVPKIEDVDEDEIVAAEERGEKIYEAEEEEEDETEVEEEAANDRAEVRASAPTAGYQQRTAERPAYDRDRRPNYRDRNRRGPGGRRNFRSRPNNGRHQPLITDLLKEGQEVLIQIAKEPIGKKGARITSHIALPGRFLVYMPTVNHVGVSRKISSDEERQRLKRIVTSERENGLGGFIVRTAAANIKEEDLRADIRFLKHLWHEIKDRAENSKSPALIYHDLNLVERVLRDQVNADFSQIWVDTEDEYERIVRFANRFQP
ncbi:MAG TPA: ribonuclease E/G, partial [Bryocella sp.]|nr:ribonuclease E/G [Bryocella sp.]